MSRCGGLGHFSNSSLLVLPRPPPLPSCSPPPPSPAPQPVPILPTSPRPYCPAPLAPPRPSPQPPASPHPRPKPNPSSIQPVSTAPPRKHGGRRKECAAQGADPHDRHCQDGGSACWKRTDCRPRGASRCRAVPPKALNKNNSVAHLRGRRAPSAPAASGSCIWASNRPHPAMPFPILGPACCFLAQRARTPARAPKPVTLHLLFADVVVAAPLSR